MRVAGARLVIAPTLTPVLRQPHVPVEVGGEASNSNTAEANGTLYGGEDDEVIRFVAPHDDPQEGCSTCDGCKEVRDSDRGKLKHQKHSCWKAGKLGQAIARENKRREAAVAAEREAGIAETADAAPALDASTENAAFLAPGDDPMQGCAECSACTAINTPKGRASGSHTCWAQGLVGGAMGKEKKRRDAMLAAALAALVEQGGLSLTPNPSPKP